MAKKSSKKRSADGFSSDILFIVTIAIAALLFISIIGIGGKGGSLISDLLFGILGLFAFIFPFFLVFFSFVLLFLLPSKNHTTNTIDFIMCFLTFLSVCLICELIMTSVTGIVSDPLEAYSIGRIQHAGGGFIGGALSFVLVSLIGRAGAFIVAIAIIAIEALLITGISLLGWFKDKREKRIEKNKARKVKKAELKEERKAERKENRPVAKIYTENENQASVRNLFSKEIEKTEYDKPENDYEDFESPEMLPTELSDPIGFTENTPVPIADVEETEPIGPEQIIYEKVVAELSATQNEEKSEIKIESIESIEPKTEPIVSLIEPEPEPEPEPEIGEKIELEATTESETVEESETLSLSESTVEEPEKLLSEPVTEEPVNETVIEEPVYEPINEEPVYESSIEEHTDFNASADSSYEEFSYEEEAIPEPADISEIEEAVTDEIKDSQTRNSDEVSAEKPYVFPPVSLLAPFDNTVNDDDSENLNETAEKLVTTLMNFGVEVTVSDISRGPAVTRFELIPKLGVKVSKIINLSDDIKLNLAASDIRIEAPIPGKSAVGIEVPNKKVSMVHFSELIESREFRDHKSPISFGAGKDLGGNIVISDIAKMPHVLIAGATGSGKSVCINTIIMSILFKAKPTDVKFIMIDPKVVELSVYNGIPHLLVPVVSDPKKAAAALHWAVREMEDRYKKFAELGVRDLIGYNKKSGENLPQIVVIVDELADLMMVAGNEVEESICRLAQLARACGIHLVIATQRPSVNVITGLIKANMPSRIAFAVTSGIDSRTILDMNGAEKLLGKGDMLYFPQGYTKPVRVQGAFVSDDEVTDVVDFIKDNNSNSNYDKIVSDEVENAMFSAENTSAVAINSNMEDGRDDYFEACGKLIIEKEKGSIGMLQRNFKIGFNRAARIMDQLAEAGVVGPEEGTKPRKVLVTIDEFEQICKEGS